MLRIAATEADQTDPAPRELATNPQTNGAIRVQRGSARHEW